MDEFNCDYCGQELEILGILGTKEHGRCPDCGTQQSRDVEDLDQLENHEE